MNEVAKVAETLDHHPVISINWNTIRLSLKSIDVDAVTRRDIDLGKEIMETKKRKFK